MSLRSPENFSPPPENSPSPEESSSPPEVSPFIALDLRDLVALFNPDNTHITRHRSPRHKEARTANVIMPYEGKLNRTKLNLAKQKITNYLNTPALHPPSLTRAIANFKEESCLLVDSFDFDTTHLFLLHAQKDLALGGYLEYNVPYSL